ncbi:SRPBCC domain-containing protein [Myxococcota bacterium]|nr:SRPBCC domain-containing protein [Myxococcota bacterium]
MYGLRTYKLEAQDLDGAKRFYTRALGKPPYFDQPFYVGFEIEGYELGLTPAESKTRGPGQTTTYLAVNDVDAEMARWLDLGCTEHEAATDVGEGIRVGAVLDPFGNPIGFIRNLHFAPRLTTADADDLSPRELVKEAVVPLARAAVWSLWATAEGLKTWLVKDARVELRPGGAYEVLFLDDRPVGTRGSEGCRVLSFVRERMLSFTWNAPPHLATTRWEHTWVVVELADDERGTRVRVTHTGWPTSGLAREPQWEQTFAYFDRAWEGVLRALDERARAPHA